MRKYFGLLVGGLAMLLFASTASATFIQCNTPVSGGVGNSSYAGQPITMTCPGFNLTGGNTLVDIQLVFENDATAPSVNNSGAIQWTWHYVSGLPSGPADSVFTEIAGSGAYNNCQNVSGPMTDCNFLGTPNVITYAVGQNGSVNSILFQVSGAAVGPGVSAINGAIDSSVWIQYDESGPAPEPATFGLIGGGLLVLGLVGRKFRKA